MNGLVWLCIAVIVLLIAEIRHIQFKHKTELRKAYREGIEDASKEIKKEMKELNLWE